MEFFENEEVLKAFDTCPEKIRDKLFSLRTMIIQTAKESRCSSLRETLKWGQPSYISPEGSTIRMAAIDDNRYGLYVHCQTRLIETFRELYPDILAYEGNRAICFTIAQTVPIKPLKHCLALALTYHKVKHLPLLGA